MRVTFLGTSGAVPHDRARNTSAVFVNREGTDAVRLR